MRIPHGLDALAFASCHGIGGAVLRSPGGRYVVACHGVQLADAGGRPEHPARSISLGPSPKLGDSSVFWLELP